MTFITFSEKYGMTATIIVFVLMFAICAVLGSLGIPFPLLLGTCFLIGWFVFDFADDLFTLVNKVKNRNNDKTS